MVVGRIRRALNSFWLKNRRSFSFNRGIKSDPVYLLSLSKTEKSVRLKPIKDALIGFQIKPQLTTKHSPLRDVPMIKCPYCASEGVFKELKEWKFRFYNVKRL